MNAATERQRRRFLHTWSKQWRAIRSAQLNHSPLCEDCHRDGIVTIAREVDHNTGDTARNRVGIELSSLCKPCHSRRTARRESGLPSVIGCDADGWPLDPAHPWNREAKNRQQPASLGTPPKLSFNAKRGSK